jgi:hypothetical protein
MKALLSPEISDHEEYCEKYGVDPDDPLELDWCDEVECVELKYENLTIDHVIEQINILKTLIEKRDKKTI